MMRRMTTRVLFPDTNILLHYPPLQHIDWLDKVSSSSVRLIICLQVVKELDAKKDDPRLAERPRRVLRELREYAKVQEIRKNVKLSIYNEEIRVADFPSSLSPDSAHDRIVFQVRQFRQANPTDAVSVVTEDYGMELRCEASGLDVVRLPQDLRLDDPTTESDRKSKRLNSSH